MRKTGLSQGVLSQNRTRRDKRQTPAESRVNAWGTKVRTRVGLSCTSKNQGNLTYSWGPMSDGLPE